MTVAIVIDYIFPDKIGGIQKYGYELCKYLAREKIHIYLYFIQGQDKIENMGVFNAAELAYITARPVPAPQRHTFPFHYFQECYAYSRNVYEVIRQDMAKIDFICAVHGFSAWELVNQKQKGQKMPPMMTDFHGMNMFLPIYGNIKNHIQAIISRYFVKKIMRKSDYIRSCGDCFTKIITACNIDSKHIYQMPNLIGSEWLSDKPASPSSAKTLIYVGRYDMAKGIAELSFCLEKLLQTHDFVCHFVGPFPEDKQIKSPKIRYHGAIFDKKKLKEIYEKSDIYILPSYTESMSLTILESMACKCAIISTDVGSISDINHAKIGWLIAPYDKDALYIAMKEALEMDNATLMNIQEQNRVTIEKRFTWDSCIKQFVADIESFVHADKRK